MDRKSMPLLLMLAAGAAACIVTWIRRDTVLTKLVALFVVMLVFYAMGCGIRLLLDHFDRQNEKRLKEEGEVIEKEAQDDASGEGSDEDVSP